MDEQDVCEITVSVERYDKAIDQSLDKNEIEGTYSNTQDIDANFKRGDDHIQASIADITG